MNDTEHTLGGLRVEKLEDAFGGPQRFNALASCSCGVELGCWLATDKLPPHIVRHHLLDEHLRQVPA